MRAKLATAALTLALASGCGAGDVVAEDGGGATSSATPTTSPAPGPQLPDGWRWESYRDAAIAVPGDWHTYESSDQRLGQWCIAEPGTARGAVGRPGGSTLVGCTADDPGLVSRTGTFVAFTAGDPAAPGPDREQVVEGGTRIVVQAPAELRGRILATARELSGSDPNGCPLDHPIADDRTWRPPARAVADLADADVLAACKYALRQGDEPATPGPDLLSSVRIAGEGARTALAAVAAAPVGSGPNQPEECMASYSYGDEAIVVLAERDGRELGAFVLRYSSCDHNGFDDGAEVRGLTVDAVAPFIAGSNAVNAWGGSGKAAILGHPESAAAEAVKR